MFILQLANTKFLNEATVTEVGESCREIRTTLIPSFRAQVM